jgi:tetratricopeptide (TPR) repeat protein
MLALTGLAAFALSCVSVGTEGDRLKSAEKADQLLRQSIALKEQGRQDNAESALENGLELKIRSSGSDPGRRERRIAAQGVASDYWALGGNAVAGGNYDEAVLNYEIALAIQEHVFGKYDELVVSTLSDLALFYREHGEYEKAEPLFERALEIRERKLGGNHPHVRRSLSELAAVYELQGKYSEAEPLLERALADKQKGVGADHPVVAKLRERLAGVYAAQGKTGALATLKQGLAPTVELPAEHREILFKEIDPDATYLQPNYRDEDGTPAYVHVTRADMPIRVAIGYPRVPARYGSREDTRRVAIEAMRMWEEAIQWLVPWFELEFVEDDPQAAVQVVWKSRIAGPWGGRGGLRTRVVNGKLWVGGEMQVSTTPMGSYGVDARVELDEIRVLIAHEFGHVLGLGHCLDCDSAMNYSWHTQGRVIVTELDALTFGALLQKPNGLRVDGRPLSFLPEDAIPDVGGGEDR